MGRRRLSPRFPALGLESGKAAVPVLRRGVFREVCGPIYLGFDVSVGGWVRRWVPPLCGVGGVYGHGLLRPFFPPGPVPPPSGQV